MPRLFVGLDLPDVLKQAVGELQVGLRDARWLDEDGLHLTLAFIGEVDHSARRRIEEALARVDAPPLGIGLHGLGHYPLRSAPRVLWTGASPATELGSLAAAIRRALARAGFPPERRKFAPHVTIARFRRPPPPAALAEYLGDVLPLSHPRHPGHFVPAALERVAAVRRPVRDRIRISPWLENFRRDRDGQRCRGGNPSHRNRRPTDRADAPPTGESGLQSAAARQPCGRRIHLSLIRERENGMTISILDAPAAAR